jgi:DNA polymerase (family 10)
LLQRDSFPFDFEAIAGKAAERGVWLEVNASPERLDLHAPLLRSAKRKGVRFTISTDSHQIRHLQNMQYGITMARRGWLEAGDVMNTLPLAQFEEALARR